MSEPGRRRARRDSPYIYGEEFDLPEGKTCQCWRTGCDNQATVLVIFPPGSTRWRVFIACEECYSELPKHD